MFFPVDLTPFYNNDGFAIYGNFSETDNFDKWGYAYPADLQEPRIPWGKAEIEGVPFKMPLSPDALNNIACAGQRIKVKPGDYRYVLILESATNGDQKAKLVFNYSDGTSQTVETIFTDWAMPPHPGEIPIFTFPFRYDVKNEGVHGIIVNIFLKKIEIDGNRTLVSMDLPKNDEVHVFAITLASDLTPSLKEAFAKPPRIVYPWEKIPWLDYKEGPEEVYTTFQTYQPYTPYIDTKADSVMSYDTYPGKASTWKGKGMRLWSMYNSVWANANLPIFKNHPELIQLKKDGKPWVIIKGRYWAVPYGEWIDFTFERIKKGIDAGVEYIALEEPEFSFEAGYSGAFRKAWKEFYNETYVPPHQSRDAAFKAGRLACHLLSNFYEQVFKKVKQVNPEIETSIALHSIFHYITMFVTPYYEFINNPYVDSIIGQVWTGTARVPFMLRGENREYIFRRAYLEYSFFASMKIAWPSKDMFFLTDPVEDNPNYTWEGYRKWYLQTLAAELLFPEVDKYELIPWPERVIALGAKYSGETMPPDYLTQLFLIWDMQRHLHRFRDDVEYLSGAPAFFAPISQTASYQRMGGFSFDLNEYFGMVGPLLDQGVGTYSYMMEALMKKDLPEHFKVALIDYQVSKPDYPQINEKLAEWVKNGGRVVIFQGDDPFCQLPNSWWRKEGFSTPTEHLFHALGIDVSEKKLTYGEPEQKLNSLDIYGRSVHDMSNLAVHAIDLSYMVPARAVVVIFRDPTPSDGWGPNVREVELETDAGTIKIVPGTDEEKTYLYNVSPPGGVGMGCRWADNTGSFSYILPLEGAFRKAILKVKVGNDFIVEVAPFSGALPSSMKGPIASGVKVFPKPPYIFYLPKDGKYRVFLRTSDGLPLVWMKKVGKGQVWHVAFSPGYFSTREGYQMALNLYRAVYSGFKPRGYFAVRRGPYIVGYTLRKSFKLKGLYIDILNPEMPLVRDPVVSPEKPFIFADPRKLKVGVFLAGGRIRPLQFSDDKWEFVFAGPQDRVSTFAMKLPSPKSKISIDITSPTGKKVYFEAVKTGSIVRVFVKSMVNGYKVVVKFGEEGKLPPLSRYRLVFRPKFLGYLKGDWLCSYPSMKKIVSINQGQWYSKGGSYLHTDVGLQTTGKYVCADGNSYGIWKFPVKGLKHLILKLHLANNFVIQISRDGKSWTTALNSQEFFYKDYHALENEAFYYFDLSPLLPSDYVYVKLGDASPNDGWGGILRDLEVLLPIVTEKGSQVLIGWRQPSPAVVFFNGVPYRMERLDDAFPYKDKLPGAYYFAKVEVISPSVLKIYDLDLPVYVASPGKKNIVVGELASPSRVSVEKPAPLVDLVLGSVVRALYSEEKTSYKNVLQEVPPGYKLIVQFSTDSDESFIYEDRSSKGGMGRFTDRNSYIIYRIKVPYVCRDFVLAAHVGNDFAVYASTDAKKWVKVVNSVELLGASFHDLGNYKWYYFKLTGLDLPARYVYIKITDATENDGWGASFSEIKLYGRLPR